MRLPAIAAILLAAVAGAWANDPPRRLYAPWVTCHDDTTGDLAGPLVITTPVVTSPDYLHRAYARVEARNEGLEPDSCDNTAVLYVSDNGEPFRPVYTQHANAPDEANMGSLGPAGWSADSRWLFVERSEWRHASDCCGWDVMLYDAKLRRTVDPPVFQAIERRTGKRCLLDYAGFLGFDDANRMILRIRHWQYGRTGEEPCGLDAATWFFDPVTNKAQFRAVSREEKAR